MDLNREQIEQVRENAEQIAKHGVDDPAIITALCTLALRGLEGQWRDIEEAEKNGSYIYAWNPRLNKIFIANWNDDRHSKRPRPFWNYPHLTVTDSRQSQPSYYLPLSALPAPPEGK